MNVSVNGCLFLNIRLRLIFKFQVPNLKAKIGHNSHIKEVKYESLTFSFEHPDQLEMHEEHLPGEEHAEKRHWVCLYNNHRGHNYSDEEVVKMVNEEVA